MNVHFLYPPELFHFLALRPLFRYRLILSAHGSDVLRPIGPKARFVPHVLRRADVVTSVSPAITDRLVDWGGVDPDRIVEVSNRVDLDHWHVPDREHGGTTLIGVGRLEQVKGFDLLLDALALVHESMPMADLVLVGDGPERDSLDRRARSLGVRERVEFTGRLAPGVLKERLAAADVFVLSSRSEGTPLALLESMAAGLPCVVTDVGGVGAVVDGAPMCPADDPRALAALVLEVLRDADYRQELSKNARARAEQLCEPTDDTNTHAGVVFGLGGPRWKRRS